MDVPPIRGKSLKANDLGNKFSTLSTLDGADRDVIFIASNKELNENIPSSSQVPGSPKLWSRKKKASHGTTFLSAKKTSNDVYQPILKVVVSSMQSESRESSAGDVEK
ncbi:BmrR [Sesbania bispinosa]|nr:BmrR [Sesbania bispinosa]